MRASEVPTMSVEALIPYARNSRTHSEDQVAQIAASIREFGFTNPVLVDAKGEIIAGHGRVMAAKLLGLASVPVLVLDHLTAAQRRAYVIADNKLAMNAGWDEDVLRAEIEALGEGFDLDLLGFDGDELDALLNPPNSGRGDPDDVPEPPEVPTTQPGDVWLMGGHRIICGDSTDAETAAAVAASQASLLLSDPPYGIGYDYASHDDRDNSKNAELVAAAFAQCPAPKAWTPGLPNLSRDISRFGSAKVLVWSKKFAAAGNGLGGASTWEPVLVVGKPPAKALPNDVIEVMTDREQVGGISLRKLHSCPKPVALYAQLAEALTKPRQRIYEPFSGSGTTLIACEKTGRTCAAVEIDPAYVDVAVLRWEEFTGKTATLEATGQTFQEVQDERRRQAAA